MVVESLGWRAPAAFAAAVTREPGTTDPDAHGGGWTDRRGSVTGLTALSAND